MFPDPRLCRLSFEYPGSAGAGPRQEIDGETVETVADFIFLGSKITADGDCSHEIKRRLLLEETQAGIKIAGRNVNNLRYADDTTLMAESEEELKSLLMKSEREWKKLA